MRAGRSRGGSGRVSSRVFERPTRDVAHSPLDRAKGHEIVWSAVAPLLEGARGIRDISFVYFVGESDGPIKIGFAKDPIARLRTMQTGNPRRMRIEHLLVGDMPMEKLLHEMWEPFAIMSAGRVGKPDAAPGTEWFRAEIRSVLAPIIGEAVAWQCRKLRRVIEDGDPLTGKELQAALRKTHREAGIVLQGRDMARTLAPAAGYVNLTRGSRI